MRNEFSGVMGRELAANVDSVLILGDIGVYGHRESFLKYPDRVFNIGILEQSMISFAAGLAIEGISPTVHTIAPFLVERAFEQIKIDFGYQSLGGNFITVGASLDYAGLGATHHCPGDVGMMLNIPGTEIYVPGTATEFSEQFSWSSRNQKISYFRLSETKNKQSIGVKRRKGFLIKSGNLATVIAVGPMFDVVIEATSDLDVTILYYNTVAPFDADLLKSNLNSGKLFIVEPFYENTLATVTQPILRDQAVLVRSKGVPRRFITKYGKIEQHYEEFGLNAQSIRREIQEMVDV